jgi:hypothetical protein
MWNCSTDVDEKFLSAACGNGAEPALDAAQVEPPVSETAETPAAAAEPATPAASEGAANEVTCDEAFRGTEAYQALGPAGQEQLREACNTWRLEQLDVQVRAEG